MKPEVAKLEGHKKLAEMEKVVLVKTEMDEKDIIEKEIRCR